jgi:hypothetical protein
MHRGMHALGHYRAKMSGLKSAMCRVSASEGPSQLPVPPPRPPSRPTSPYAVTVSGPYSARTHATYYPGISLPRHLVTVPATYMALPPQLKHPAAPHPPIPHPHPRTSSRDQHTPQGKRCAEGIRHACAVR